MNSTEEPIWLTKPMVINLHRDHIQEFGGAEGATYPNTI